MEPLTRRLDFGGGAGALDGAGPAVLNTRHAVSAATVSSSLHACVPH
jgi:hypothetical protein